MFYKKGLRQRHDIALIMNMALHAMIMQGGTDHS